jgi:hypothetical protein
MPICQNCWQLIIEGRPNERPKGVGPICKPLGLPSYFKERASENILLDWGAGNGYGYTAEIGILNNLKMVLCLSDLVGDHIRVFGQEEPPAPIKTCKTSSTWIIPQKLPDLTRMKVDRGGICNGTFRATGHKQTESHEECRWFD